MKLSEELLKDFAKTVVPKEARIKQDRTAYGVVRMVNGETYVQFDGAGINTPASTTVEINNGDRVIALLKDRKAVITGNVTTPIAKGSATFFQNTEPDSTGRKLGDIWFDTGNGYRMKRWNGTGWELARFDSPALNVQYLSSISANLGAINAGSINIGNGKFQVGPDGTLQATGATISGAVTAHSGTIGGFTIEDGWMHSTHFVLSPEGRTGDPGHWEEINGDLVWTETTYASDDPRRTTALNINDNFLLSTTGEVTAKAGHLGSFILDNHGLYNEDYQIGVRSSGSGAVSGAIYFGDAGYISPTETSFSGLLIGSSFKVYDTGYMECSSGNIAGFNIDSSKLRYDVATGYIELNSQNRSITIYDNTSSQTRMYTGGLECASDLGRRSNITPGVVLAGASRSAVMPSTVDSFVSIRGTSDTVQANGEHGLYDETNSKWMMYVDKDGNLCIPQRMDFTGGTSSGNIQILNNTTTDPIRFRLSNASLIGALQITTAGEFGLYDITRSQWVLYADTNGYLRIPVRTYLSGVTYLTNNNFLQTINLNGNGLTLIGMSSSDQIWVGPQNFARVPNRLILAETIDKIYVYNSSGGQTLISTAVSDERLKYDICELEHSRKFIMALRPKQFKYVGGDETINFGFVAQEVRPVLEEMYVGDSAVLAFNPTDTESGNYDRFDENTFHYSMDYKQFIAPIVALEQEHEREIASLKEDISNLREMLAALIEQKA